LSMEVSPVICDARLGASSFETDRAAILEFKIHRFGVSPKLRARPSSGAPGRPWWAFLSFAHLRATPIVRTLRMFHSTKLIAEAGLPSAEEPQAAAPPVPEAKRPRHTLWLTFGGLALVATAGAGWLTTRPVCGCALQPISQETLMMLGLPRPVTLTGRAAQAVPVGSALANKGSDPGHMAIRADSMRPGAVTAVLSQPVHAGSTVPH
jgi:hypothetical protein